MRHVDKVLGPWPLGMDNVNTDTPVEDAVPRAENVRFNKLGEAIALREPLTSGDLVDFRAGEYWIKDRVLHGSSGEIGYIGQGPYHADLAGFGVVSGAEHRYTLLSLPVLMPIAPPPIRFTEEGGYSSGTTRIFAHRSGVSSSVLYTTSGVAMVITDPGAVVFATMPNGAEFYVAGSADSDGEFEFVSPPKGGVAPPGLEDLVAMPAGGLVCVVGSRLAVAQYEALLYSAPFSPWGRNVYSFLSLPGPITMLAEAGGFLFVGYRGTNPGLWVIANLGEPDMRVVAKHLIEVFSADPVRVPAEKIMEGVPGEVSVWMTASGIQIGLPTGQVNTPASERVSVSGPTEGVLAYNGTTFLYYSRG